MGKNSARTRSTRKTKNHFSPNTLDNLRQRTSSLGRFETIRLVALECNSASQAKTSGKMRRLTTILKLQSAHHRWRIRMSMLKTRQLTKSHRCRLVLVFQPDQLRERLLGTTRKRPSFQTVRSRRFLLAQASHLRALRRKYQLLSHRQARTMLLSRRRSLPSPPGPLARRLQLSKLAS